MKATKPILSDDQLAALDVMKSTAAQNLDADDLATLDGIEDVIAGRTLTQDEFNDQMKAIVKELKAKQT